VRWVSVLLIVSLLSAMCLPGVGIAHASVAADQECATMAMDHGADPYSEEGSGDVSFEKSRCAFACSILPPGLRLDLHRLDTERPVARSAVSITSEDPPPLQPPKH
jgi:hypothetical protein